MSLLTTMSNINKWNEFCGAEFGMVIRSGTVRRKDALQHRYVQTHSPRDTEATPLHQMIVQRVSMVQRAIVAVQ